MSVLLAYPNENSCGIVHAYEGKMCSGRISSSHHCKVCWEQVEALLGMGVKVQPCGKSTPAAEDAVSGRIGAALGRWGAEGGLWAGRSLTGLHHLELSVVLSHRAACVKGGAGPDKPCHQQPQ